MRTMGHVHAAREQRRAEQALKDVERLRAVLETMRKKLRVDDPHDLYDLVCNALRPNVI